LDQRAPQNSEAALHQASCLVDGIGLWSEIRSPARTVPGPILLLDRDGVINEDTGYLCDPAQVAFVSGIAQAIAHCNRAGIPVAVVTNQSGISRGFFGWEAFASVQRAIDERLAKEGARLDGIFACGYHRAGESPLAREHDWRKPKPGMLLAALRAFNGDPAKSAMIGDKVSDMEAAATAGIEHRFLLGSNMPTADGVRLVDSPEEAVAAFLGCLHERPQ
jgi:D-glycero-D-manno-heptose 1,7-bisphosphate phosphatase